MRFTKMPRPPPDPARLTLLLQARGAMHSGELAVALQVSPATLLRLVAMGGSSVERIGAGRATRYAHRRPVRNLGSEWSIYRIGEDGRPQVWGGLRALHGGFRLVPRGAAPAWMLREYPGGIFSGLPFFLQDVRPQGYLGRACARDAAPRLGVSEDVRNWNDDDVLSYLLTEGADLPGDLVVGERAVERALRAADDLAVRSVADADRPRVYPERAAAAQRGELTGSSAGGEQPKFLAVVRRGDGAFQSVLVKFSAAEFSPVSERWSDLLACEHLAAETMRERQVSCTQSQLLRAGGRCFLEVERFDRVGASGRRGLLTLGATTDAFLESNPADWVRAAAALEAAGWISAKSARMLSWLWCFGDLIANSDMHRANASVWFGDNPPFKLAPGYDMLPMLYAPGSQGELGERVFAPRPPLAGVADIWADAAAGALAFWERVSADESVSDSFRAIAGRNRETVQGLVGRFGSVGGAGQREPSSDFAR